ncbi:MAG: Lrp/AsnC family transcriptional regulator [Dehalococcoidia bacterium]|nr:Lrp/AsnC family transcriptional regulator [Dehalococcoidia bacterium]MSQ17122.1 Lrp/AsnC family transcriptional regulator [Dehalococcoidia bacterium]
MDLTDRKLLNLIQSRFPLADEPYRALGQELELDEAEVIQRLAELKRQNVLRQISAIFDTRRLGYKTTLVALAYDPEQLHQGALLINRHPGVSHNYAREGSYYNLWFTLAVPPDEDLAETVARMARDTHALTCRVMPTLRFFKIGVNFDMVQQKSDAYNFRPDGDGDEGMDPGWNQAVPVSEADKAVIRELQEDLLLESRPFDAMARRLGMTTAQLFSLAQQFQERKIMRRYSAVLHHRRSGFRANAMIVWKVPEAQSQEVGLKMAQHSAVTHCYQRPTFPDWPYTHFTMVHATTPEGCEEVAQQIVAATGISDRLLLYSTREYKKTRVRYFVSDYEEYREAEEEEAVTAGDGA